MGSVSHGRCTPRRPPLDLPRIRRPRRGTSYEVGDRAQMLRNDYLDPAPSPRLPCQNRSHDLPFHPLRAGSPDRRIPTRPVGSTQLRWVRFRSPSASCFRSAKSARGRPVRCVLPRVRPRPIPCGPTLGRGPQSCTSIIRLEPFVRFPVIGSRQSLGGVWSVPSRRDRIRQAAQSASVRLRSAHPHR
jgi:hypothetical protein